MEKFRKIMLCPCRHLKKVAVDPKIIGLWIDKKLQNLFMYQFVANNTMFLAPAKVWCVRSLLLFVFVLVAASLVFVNALVIFGYPQSIGVA